MTDTSKTIDRAKDAVVDAFDDTRDRLDSGLDAARDLFEELADDVSEKAGATRREVRRRAEAARAFAKDKLGSAKEGLRQGYDRVRKDVGELSTDVNEYVRDNPGKSILIAAAVGFAIGLLVRGRRDD